MSFPFTFANLAAGNNPASDLDVNFNAALGLGAGMEAARAAA